MRLYLDIDATSFPTHSLRHIRSQFGKRQKAGFHPFRNCLSAQAFESSSSALNVDCGLRFSNPASRSTFPIGFRIDTFHRL